MSRPADEEMIGRNVAGKFLVEKFLGGGAMGAVYKAYQKSIEKHVAIKVLHKEFGAEASFVSRFEREAKAASLLDHVNLMRVLDYGAGEGKHLHLVRSFKPHARLVGVDIRAPHRPQ